LQRPLVAFCSRKGDQPANVTCTWHMPLDILTNSSQYTFEICSRLRTSYVPNLTFRGPCIVIYSYNKNQLDALISQIYFWYRILHVSDSFSVHHQEPSTVHTAIDICHTGYADCLLAGSAWNILIPLEDSQHNLYDMYVLLCTVLDS
jgi:hypothetical protein